MSSLLVLVFAAGANRYALATKGIIEVLPVIALRPLPDLPPEIAGLLDFRGTVVPVIDVNRMLLGSPCPDLLSSRIILHRYPVPDRGEQVLGLRVERIKGTQHLAASELQSSGLLTAPWLGQLTTRDCTLLQLVTPEQLLSPEVRARLYPPETI